MESLIPKFDKRQRKCGDYHDFTLKEDSRILQ